MAHLFSVTRTLYYYIPHIHTNIEQKHNKVSYDFFLELYIANNEINGGKEINF